MKKATKKLREKFNESSKAERRVIIAQDVLKHIVTKEYFINKGAYLRLPEELFIFKNVKKKLQSLFGQINQCKVCALGAIFMSKCSINDGQILGDSVLDYRGDDTLYYTSLRKHFSNRQLVLIESAFEMEDDMSSMSRYQGGIDCIKSIAFGKNFSDSPERLTAIMNNLIKNKGTFKP